MNKIYLCGGNKGGTGKSMLATALIDAFLQRGVEPVGADRKLSHFLA